MNIDFVLLFQNFNELTSVTDYFTEGCKIILKEQKDGNGSLCEYVIEVSSVRVLAIYDDIIKLTMEKSLKQGFESVPFPNFLDSSTKLENNSSKAFGNSRRLLFGYIKNMLPGLATVGVLGNLL